MSQLLIVHHTPSPHCQEMFEAVLSGASDPEIEGVQVVRRPALTCSAADMLDADGYLPGSPASLGYISGASTIWCDTRLVRSLRYWPHSYSGFSDPEIQGRSGVRFPL